MALALALAAVIGCRGGDGGTRGGPGSGDAAAARPRPRPAELAYLTLKVLGVT